MWILRSRAARPPSRRRWAPGRVSPGETREPETRQAKPMAWGEKTDRPLWEEKNDKVLGKSGGWVLFPSPFQAPPARSTEQKVPMVADLGSGPRSESPNQLGFDSRPQTCEQRHGSFQAETLWWRCELILDPRSCSGNGTRSR